MTNRTRYFIALSTVGILAAAAAAVVITRAPHDPAPIARVPISTAPSQPHEDMAPGLRAMIAQAPTDLRIDLEKIYSESEFKLVWTSDRAGRKRIQSLASVTSALVRQGVDPIFVTEAQMALASAGMPEDRVKADIQLTTAVLKAARGERFGFISAKKIDWNLAADEAEIASFLGEAIVNHKLEPFFTGLRPHDAQFQSLTEALAQYREIAAAGGWPAIPEGKELDFDGDPRLPVLHRRLAAEGYLPADGSPDGHTLREALKAYQGRNGLEPDGRAGRGTLAALNTPVEKRIGQIVANLERRRHMRHDTPDTYVLANVADQSVVVVRNGREDLRLRTVVGTRRHATPMLEATMTAVTLNPAWEIPTSIITNEILPKLEEEPAYLENNDMDVVSGDWDKPKSLRMRQRPGAGNALGHMKFQMQNQWNIYLHDTPNRSLFAKDDRYFSHGCVRVHQPHELAVNLLKGKTVEELNEIIASGQTRTIKLEESLPVFVLYWSVFTDSDGKLNFRRDAYDRDAKTVAMLADAGLLGGCPEVAARGAGNP